MTTEQAIAILQQAGYSDQEIHDLTVRGELIATAQAVRAAGLGGGGGGGGGAEETGLTILGPNYAIDSLGNTYTYGAVLDANGVPTAPAWQPTGTALTGDQMKALGIIPTTWAGGGGGAVREPNWQPGTDPATGNLAFYDPTTGAYVVSPFKGDESESVFTLTEGERLLARDPETGEVRDITPGGRQPTIINREDGIYSFDPETKALTKLADFPMSDYDKEQLQLQRQQLALEASQAGYPEVAYTAGGQNIRQVSPAKQIMAGEQPHVAFEAPPAAGVAPATPGGIPGYALNPATGKYEPIPGQAPTSVAPLTREAIAASDAEMARREAAGVSGVTPTRAQQIATAFAQVPAGAAANPYWRLGGLAATNKPKNWQEQYAYSAALEKANPARLTAGPVAQGTTIASVAIPAAPAATIAGTLPMTDEEKRRRYRQAYAGSIAGRRMAVA
jgi:hypothetical protein